MRIGNFETKGKVALAPMAGVTDLAFRNVCYDFGASYCVSEMVSSKAVVHGDLKTKELMDITADKGPVAIQLFGCEPLVMAKACEEVSKLNPIFIDVNMGCPAPKIAGNGCGAALMKNPELCGNIVKEMLRATTLPITVKIRKGWDDDSVNAVEVAKICEDAGASAITVHGRTRQQMYRPFCDMDIIKEVKENVSVPVIGNGDVNDVKSAWKMLSHTNCDAVMVGRGALGNPWVFSQISASLLDSFRILPDPPISKKILVIREHIIAMCESKGEARAMREARKHIAWYIHGVRGAAQMRKKSGTLCTINDLDEFLKELYIITKERINEGL